MRNKLVVFSDLGGKMRSGPVKFGRDWPGTYIEGLNSLGYSWALESLLKKLDRPFVEKHIEVMAPLNELCRLLGQCHVTESHARRAANRNRKDSVRARDGLRTRAKVRADQREVLAVDGS